MPDENDFLTVRNALDADGDLAALRRSPGKIEPVSFDQKSLLYNSPDDRTAKAAEKSAVTLDELKNLAVSLETSLETERSIRSKADRNLRLIAILTLAANWGALAVAILAFFR